MDQKPATGAIPSGGDYRDKIAATFAVATATTTGYFNQYLGGVLMQAQEPACVAHSLIKIAKVYFFLRDGVWLDLSPRFLDILMKRYDGQDRATGGAIPRLGLKLLVQFGCCTNAMLPNDTSLPVLEYRDDALLTDAVFENAALHRIPGFVGVPVEFNATRTALSLYKALSTTFLIGSELWLPSWADRDIDPLRTPKVVVDGHQMTQCGFQDPKLNILENEWSTAWGKNGQVQFDPVAWAPYTVEQWAVAEIPADVADYLKNLPAASNFHYQWDMNLAVGDNNKDIKSLQIAFMILGLLAPIAPSELGIFGPKTAAANLKYQAEKGIKPESGANVGPLTRAALNKDFAL